MATACILSIGDELLIGDTVNTNASHIGARLHESGIEVRSVVTLPDEGETIRLALAEHLSRHDLVVTTGGLGPTHDDVTLRSVCELFETDLVLEPRVLRAIEKVFAERSLPMTQANRDQALVPRGARVLFNHHGTAPGLWMEREGAILVVLPGVPHEMRHLIEDEVLPSLRERFPSVRAAHTRYLRTAGEAESVLDGVFIGDLSEHFERGCTLAYLPGPGRVTLRLGCRDTDPEASHAKVEALERTILERTGFCVYGEGRETSLERVLGQVLRERGMRICTAESCTGGALASTLTDVPGSSDYVLGGFVAYSNELKISQLGVDPELLDRHGAVSSQVARAMAEGAARATGAEVAVSLTGVAGPGGGTPDKPVGLVWLGVHAAGRTFTLKLTLTRDRAVNKRRSVMIAMETVRRTLLGIDRMPYGNLPDPE